MKIPYIKIYTADLLAASRYLTSEQLGDAILGVCELAFENKTVYEPNTPREKDFFEMLLQWKEEAKNLYKQNKSIARRAARCRWKKDSVSDGTPSIIHTTTPTTYQTETKTETKTETETENINTLTAPLNAAQEARAVSFKKTGKLGPLSMEFVEQVLARFESAVQTPAQKCIFVKRNARCLKDIFDFCDQDITLALQTISVCVRRLQKAGLTGGYEAVCRNLPEYYEKAKAELAEAPHA